MPHLRIDPPAPAASGPAKPGGDRTVALDGGEVLVGRHPDCAVVLENPSVSRWHAKVTPEGGGFAVEDLGSRNRTLLNGEPLHERAVLHDGDAIRVCDVTLHFVLADPADLPARGGDPAGSAETLDGLAAPTRPPDPPDAPPDPPDDGGDPPGVLAALSRGGAGGFRLDVNPRVKLEAVLSIVRALAGSDGTDRVLDRTLEDLFRIFPQADRGFALLSEAPGEEPTVRATRTRGTAVNGPAGGGDGRGGDVRISRTLVRRVMETGEALLTADASGDDRFDGSASVADLQLRSVVCVPLHGAGERPFGLLQLDTGDAIRQFSPEDLDLLLAVAAPVGLAAENARLAAESALRREEQRDLEVAARMQRGFLPQAPPDVPGYEFGDYYESALSVGGDYFDYVPLPGGRVAVALGDVAGKGVPAALLMAKMCATARTHLLNASHLASPQLLPRAVAGLNAELAETRMGHRFITCAVMLLDPATHTLYVVNAGHMAPVVRTVGGVVEPLGDVQDCGMPLGIDGSQTFHVDSRVLKPGEAAALFTDGVTEAVREGAGAGSDGTGLPAGAGLEERANNLYGRDRLAAVLGRTAGTAAEVVAAVTADVAKWTGCGPQSDDICVVAVRRAP